MLEPSSPLIPLFSLSRTELTRLANDAQYALTHLTPGTHPYEVLQAVMKRLRAEAAEGSSCDFLHGVEELIAHWRENRTLTGAEGIVDFIIASMPSKAASLPT